MGSGKTTVGRRLARLLDRGFVDADDALEEIADRSIADIFGSDGEEAFRAMEADVLAELLEHHEPTVIAAGGGVVLHPDSRERLCRPGVPAVWLEATPAFLATPVAPNPPPPILHADPSPTARTHRTHPPPG